MSTGALSVISPTELLPPTTESTPSTVTIKVIVRHSKACKHENPKLGQDYKDCNCRKHIYIYENGNDRPISAKTRSWEKAEQMAQAERDKRDPLQQRLKEIERIVAAGMTAMFNAQATRSITIDKATALWLTTKAKEVKAESTLRTHNGVANRIRGWAEAHNIRTVHELTRINLDEWRGDWGPDAVASFSRMKSSTQSHFQGYLVGFLDYMVDVGTIEKNPVATWKGIPVDCEPPQPLTPNQFNDVLNAIQSFCSFEPGYASEMAAEFRALFLLQRWAGLRILDALVLPRSGLVGNRLNLVTIKTKAVINGRVVPDDVVEALAALSPNRSGFKKPFFFWREGIALNSLTSIWTKNIKGMNAYLRLEDEDGELFAFKSHMLRDTCAIYQMLAGMKIDQVSKFLTHNSTAVTEKHYLRWVKARLEKLEIDYVAAMQAQGMRVSIGK
jgi:integrase/recombinase XerD